MTPRQKAIRRSKLLGAIRAHRLWPDFQFDKAAAYWLDSLGGLLGEW